MKQRYSELKIIEQRVRSSMTYHFWIRKNLGPACLNCDSTDNLQVHHIVELYHILLGLWKLYGDTDSVVAHAIAMHADDKCESVTLCKTCHEKNHPGRTFAKSLKSTRIEDWIPMPRKLPAPFTHNYNPLGLTLFSAQTLAGINWYILNGYMESRIVEFKRSQLASLLQKEGKSSFNKSLARALDNLQKLNIIVGHHTSGPQVEIHLCPEYLENLVSSPWFMSVTDIHTGKLTVFALKWFLCLQSGKGSYKIGLKKLPAHLGLTTTTPSFILKSVKKACKEIPWAHCDYDGKFISFRLKRRGAVPIWSLREILIESIREGS